MNIAKAKQQLIETAKAYFAKDEDGLYRICPREQRPVLLMGPPGIGKTAIAEQAAQEMGIGFLSYSMTHHTRQSALGLPLIEKRSFQGREYAVSEYTMSEIIASVYELMENTGAVEGILFLDEINCVSETLTPVMLQFLQYKIFGKHALPEGWMVVAAGNPPEYNRSAREFDIVTLDRLKVIHIEPDFEAWRKYSEEKGIHPAVLSFLTGHRDRFYDVHADIDGKQFATARGWSDLAEMLTACETEKIPVSPDLIAQYIQHPQAAEEFAAFYDLYRKYDSDYRIEEILAGNAPAEIRERAAAAPFDERWSLLMMLLRRVSKDTAEAVLTEDVCRELHKILLDVREKCGADPVPAEESSEADPQDQKNSSGESGSADSDSSEIKKALQNWEQKTAERRNRNHLRGILTKRSEKGAARTIAFLKKARESAGSFDDVRTAFKAETEAMNGKLRTAGEEMENLFLFAENVWPEGSELLMIVTQLSANADTARYIAKYGSEGYLRNAERLNFHGNREKLMREIE
ncbi:MAG: AAA family ATPase [Lachnospiraceae bacterium]|nr:AAA family ATPase [Lachnospiraceae bacterium]